MTDTKIRLETGPESETDAAAENPRTMAAPSKLRLMFSLALLLAGPAVTLLGIWLVWIVWRGGWAPARQEQQLEILDMALLLILSGMLGVIAAIALGEPIGRLKGSVRGIVSAEISDDQAVADDATAAPPVRQRGGPPA